MLSRWPLLLGLLVLAAANSQARVIYGPETITTDSTSLQSVERVISIAGRPHGKYLLKAYNGDTGPYRVAECKSLTPAGLARQCLAENAVEKVQTDFSRFQSFNYTLNGTKYLDGFISGRQFSYREVILNLDRDENVIKFVYQGYLTSHLTYTIEELESVDLHPKALFTVRQLSGVAPLTMYLYPRESFDHYGNPLTNSWNFGDGGVRQVNGAVTYVYNAPGSYDIALTVTNSKGQQDELKIPIVVQEPLTTSPINKAPIVRFEVTKPDPTNHRKIRVNSNGSYDPDGVINTFQVNFGDGYAATGSSVEHTYLNDGTFVVNVRGVDNSNTKSEAEKSVPIGPSGAITSLGTIYGPDIVRAAGISPIVRTLSFNVSAVDTNALYRVRLKNADGLEHPTNAQCGGFIDYLTCQFFNWQNQKFIDENRVKFAHVYVNKSRITASGDLTSDKAVFDAVVKLKEQNKIDVQLSGESTAFVEILVEKVQTELDSEPPIISLNGLNQNLTRIANQRIQVSVVDQSDVDTAVFLNEQRVFTTPQKDFEYPFVLKEGLNQVRVTSTDIGGKQSSAMRVVTLDSVPPRVTSLTPNIGSVVHANTVLISGTSDEQLVSAEWEAWYGGTPLLVNGSSFSRMISMWGSGEELIGIRLKDKAGNEVSYPAQFKIVYDGSAPEITVAGIKPFHKSSLLPIHISISDESTIVSVRVYVNDVLAFNTDFSEIDYDLPLLEGGSTSIRIEAEDSYGNVSAYNYSQIKIDRTVPRISYINPTEGTVLKSPIFDFYGFANKTIVSAKINGVSISVDNQSRFLGSYEFTTSGIQSVEISLEDIAGNIAVIPVSYDVRLNEGPAVGEAWNYMECPLE